MSTGILSATFFSKHVRTDAEDVSQCYPTDASIILSTMLIVILGGISLSLLVQRSGKTENDDNEELAEESSSLLVQRSGKTKNDDNVGVKKEELAEEISNYDKMGFVAIVSAALFSTGLFISGMTKNYKIYGFLDLTLLKKGTWDPTLIFVMGSGLITSACGYHFVEGHNFLKVRKCYYQFGASYMYSMQMELN
jgi:cellobiose-specific phosphotransferase system component IIB